MTLPSFLVIGAAKSGTTSLMSYLGQHPNVFVPSSKEPNYFALSDRSIPPKGPVPAKMLQLMLYNWSRTEMPAYRALFDQAQPDQAVGEGSVRYLYFPESAGKIRESIPDVRLVAILRDPISRLYSHYNMNRQFQLEPLPLREALNAEEDRIKAGWGWDWHYVRASLYGAQLQRYYDLFGSDQIAVFLYDDFIKDPQGVISKIFTHIGVEPAFTPDRSGRGMITRLPRNLWFDRLLNRPSRSYYLLRRSYIKRATLPVMRRLNQWNSQPVPRIDPALRKALAGKFRDDLDHLGQLIGRDILWYQDL